MIVIKIVRKLDRILYIFNPLISNIYIKNNISEYFMSLFYIYFVNHLT